MILQKKNFDWASIGGGKIFPRGLKTTQNEKIVELGQKKYFIFFHLRTLYMRQY